MAGRLDRRTVHLFNDGISTLLLTDRTAWVINANELTACDYAGLLAINDACRRAHLHNRRVTLTAAPVPLRWHLTQLRLDHHLLNGVHSTAHVPDGLSE